AAFGLASALIGGLRRPLDDLLGATGRLAAGDLDARVKPAGPVELRDLASSFNAMAGDLEGARAEIEEQRRRLATVVESLGDALVVTDADGVVEEVNPRAADLVPELEPGRSLARDPGPLPPLELALEGETQVEHGGRALSVQAARLGPERGDGVVFTVRDVSERARLERLKSEFVATASHELRSPLTSIKGFVELLGASRSLTAKQREFVEIILLSTNRLVDLVNDLLDVARVEAGRLEIHRRPTSLGGVVGEVAMLMRPRIDDARQRLELDLAPDVPSADADPARVRQIITNLLTNGHLYTPAEGRLRVSVFEDGGAVAVAVADTGRGMDAGQVERVFDRFYPAGANPTGGPSGSGLGLSIVRSLVDLHGGSIDVESEPGRGTTFTVRLPKATVGDARSPRALLHGRRVLVVDDDPSIARLIATQLEPWEVETVLVASGEEAIERLRAERLDAVTLDILMRGMSGFEVLRAVREDPELRDTAIVVVSVFSGREALAGEWVVSKPIDADELTGALGSAMLAGRTRLLVVGRESIRPRIGEALDRLGIEHDWASNGPAATRLCAARRYEVALVDAGLDAPQDVVAAIELRGRREKRAVLVFSDRAGAAGLARLDAEPLGIEAAGAAVLAALGEEVGAG
ncbi:MAG: ATP-binding protein, partial [Actinomycetota bacterium]|nr:ATP-binding protein [Actinomycetota bacterium]